MATQALTTMPACGVRASLARLLDVLGRFPLALLQLMFRLGVASVFVKAGLTKIASWETTVQLFADEYKVPVLSPELAATMAATFELGCSALLGMMVVIQTFVYPNAYSEHLTWASILLFLLTRGAGPWSLDRMLGLEPPTCRGQ